MWCGRKILRQGPCHDPERADRAQQEMEFLTHELAAAVGLGGHNRKIASHAEQA
jgi:hypothetical protein